MVTDQRESHRQASTSPFSRINQIDIRRAFSCILVEEGRSIYGTDTTPYADLIILAAYSYPPHPG